MKYILLHIFVWVSSLLYSQSWVQLPDYTGSSRDDGTTFVINTKAYCVTGLENGWQCNRNGFVFDANTETWSSIAPLPLGDERQYAIGFSHNNMGYVLGGINCNNVALNDFWQYNPTTDVWIQLPNFPNAGRFGMSYFIIKNKLYVLGGKLVDNSNLNEVWEYNFVTTTWVQKNNIPTSMWRGSGFSIDTIGYVCLGINNTGYNHLLYRYNYVADTWASFSTIHLPALTYISTAVCNNKGILYGGQDSLGNITNSVQVFNPSDSSMIIKSGVPTFGRKGSMPFSINDIFYITTGFGGSGRIKETWKNVDLVGIKQLDVDSELIKIYPNPANEFLEINYLSNEPTVIEITNAFGQVVLSQIVLTKNSRLKTDNLINGIYYLVLKTNDKVIKRKIIIQR